MEKKNVNGVNQLSGYRHFSKYLLLCSAEEIQIGLDQLEGE